VALTGLREAVLAEEPGAVAHGSESMTTPDEMSCEELVEVVTDYLEGAMSDADRARFEAHLEVCPGCFTYLDQMRRTIATLGTLSEESISPEAQDKLMAALRGWRAREQ
jgi:anti-sigma factor RsiW